MVRSRSKYRAGGEIMRGILVRFSTVAAAGAVLLGVTSGVVTAAPVRQAKASTPGHWTQATLGNFVNFADIGLVRAPNGVLHVLWTDGKTGATVVYDTPILANGTVQKSVPVSGRLSQATFPDATISGRTMYAYWNQVPNKGSATGTAVASWPASGHGWKVTSVQPAQNTNWDFGVAAAT